ncbi:helix-turn-helix domain-containing protein [Corynebacterium auriscanis]|uniref:helix-turn-helix domain-containing protein n=1 Tax=Corynebacterium auriscanis TaxID=99807 RepID=UPI0024AD6D33|nr:helix-turn-helix domain-containing protein [Corynebacterium auriscanis]
MTDSALNTTQVAEWLGISRRAVIARVQNGSLPVMQKLPGKTGVYLFDPKEIAEIAEDSNRGELNANNPDRYRRAEMGEVA